MHADAWAALAVWVTAGIAGGALWFARGQVIEARTTRKRVAQPNVVVYSDLNPKRWQWFDLVVRNFGQTSAYNIWITLPRLDVKPYFDAGREYIEYINPPEYIPVLAPGQEWRTIWDSTVAREQYELERKTNPQANLRELRNHFEGRVEYDDRRIPDKRRFANPISLDTTMFKNIERFAEGESN